MNNENSMNRKYDKLSFAKLFISVKSWIEKNPINSRIDVNVDGD